MSTHHSHLDFSREDWNRPAKFFDKCWVIAHKHNPGLNRAMELNNRTFVFQLRGKQPQDVLLVFGCADQPAIDAVRQVEQESGAKVAWVVSNGGAHHMFLDLWYQAFPTARVLIPEKRIPHTRNGLALAKKYASRWELMHGPKPKQLIEEFGGEIDVVIFDQLFGYKDQDAAVIMNSPQDYTTPKSRLGGFPLMMKFGKVMSNPTQPSDEVTFFHRASGLVIGGHNYQFMYKPKGYTPPPGHDMSFGGFPMSLMFSMMMPKGSFRSELEGQPGPIADSRIHCDEWNMVLDWDMRAWTGAHNPPTVIGPDMSGAQLKEAIRASLHKTGEDDPTGARLKWNIKHKKTGST
jgi:hypothetical protein